jgi:hypothetical protein
LEVNQFNETLEIELTPSGIINFSLLNDDWNSIPADTVVVISPYKTEKFVNAINKNSTRFNVEPSAVHHFKWFWVNNGISSDTLSKDIFVPNFYKPDGSRSGLSYKIAF